MKNLKKLTKNQLKTISGGASCISSCSNGSSVVLNTCTSCIDYQGDGVACFDSRDNSIHVANC